MRYGADPRTRNTVVAVPRDLTDGGAYEAAGAAMRAPIELETPEALRWTSPLQGTTLTNPTGLSATASHNSVTVRWDRQPSARRWSVVLHGRNGSLSHDVESWKPASWGDPATGFHEVVFRNLPAETRFRAVVLWSLNEGFEDARAETSTQTLPLPSGHQPLPRGAQNLRATATHNSITVILDQPFDAATSHHKVYLFHPDYSPATRIETAWYPNTQYTFANLESGVTYRVVLMHNSIVRVRTETSITTATAPPSNDGPGVASADRGTGTGTWPVPGGFYPVWPHALRAATGEWSALTDDAWVARSNRWHGGMDTGLLMRGGSSSQQIQALADGILHEYDPARVGGAGCGHRRRTVDGDRTCGLAQPPGAHG